MLLNIKSISVLNGYLCWGASDLKEKNKSLENNIQMVDDYIEKYEN